MTAWIAAALYLALTLFFTWPLAAGLGRDVAWDLGDPLLNMWIVSWDIEQLRALAGGDFSRIAAFFDANIFHPAPLSLAYSEHLFAQALQVLPIQLATGNPILGYNLLFLSTFVLSGVGAFLLVRELTGSWQAAFLGGLLFAFAPYRLTQHGHLQVLSSQWMPLALFGLTRYFNTQQRWALAGAAAAIVLQAWSCGYYLVYFVPFAVAYTLWEIARRGLLRSVRTWGELGVAGTVALLCVVPFLLPYARAQELLGMSRNREEVVLYSADVQSYFTAVPWQNVWGPVLDTFPTLEGNLFPGAVPLLLGLLAFGVWGVTAWREVGPANAGPHVAQAKAGPHAVSLVLLAVTAACVLAGTAAIFLRQIDTEFLGLRIRVTDITRVWIIALACAAVSVAISPRTRARARALVTPLGFFCLAIAVAWWLSLGPVPRTFGRTLEFASLYGLFYDYVPGVDGVRAPARLAMVVALMLSLAGSVALATILRGRALTAAVALLAVLFATEAHVTEFIVNAPAAGLGDNLAEARVYPPEEAPPIYRHVAALPADSVLLELPLGSVQWDLFAVYYSTTHWKPLVNGYSGFFPPGYAAVDLGLSDPDRDPALATSVLQATGTTHVLVHTHALREAEVGQLARWLNGTGARVVAEEDGDLLYEVAR